MDFKPPKIIRDYLRSMLDESQVGYLGLIPELGNAFSEFALRHWSWRFPEANLRIANETGIACIEIVKVLSEQGDSIGVSSPDPHFLDWMSQIDRRIIDVPYRRSEERDTTIWELDFKELEESFGRDFSIYILCNPASPIGTVHSQETLAKLANIARDRGVIIISDEIYGALVDPIKGFTPFIAANDAAKEVGIFLSSTSKAFNISGLKCAIYGTQSEYLERRMEQIPRAAHYRASIFGAFASVVAFRDCDMWLEEMAEKIKGKRALFDDLTRSWRGVITPHPHQSAYLAWCEVAEDSQLFHEAAKHGGLRNLILASARVGVNDGRQYSVPLSNNNVHPDYESADYSKFFRLNFATSDAILEEAILRIAKLCH
jgi:cystathionine beta-lyase